VSRGKRLKSMLHIAVTVTLGIIKSAPLKTYLLMQLKNSKAESFGFFFNYLDSNSPLKINTQQTNFRKDD